jgi:hypothetical protein
MYMHFSFSIGMTEICMNSFVLICCVQAQVLGKDVADSAPKRRVGGGTRRSSAAPTKSSASSEATRKAREEGRRKMMEERRKAMREKRDTAATSGQVEIFVPQENGN